ncbi:MAG: enoyl-CoA hydratase [Planctomycetota bacterium]|nr:MAG: enoyl-CoA hydratase [Planctomycetota bacterium]
MTDELVLEERQGAIAVLTLNRPEKRNALDLALVAALSQKLADLKGEAGLRCLVLKGAGDKAFVAGADIGELLQRDAEQSLAGINSSLFLQVEEFPVPVIAMIQGWCLGGGMELAMACDLRIASESARFGQPELKLGILPAAGGLHRLPALVGMGQAKDLVLTGRIVAAEDALRMGLVSRVVPEAELEQEAMAAAQQVVDTAPLASRLAKKTMHALFRVRPDTAFMIESGAQAVLFESEEKKRRMQEFLDKRGK